MCATSKLFILFSSFLCINQVSALNILGIFPYQGKSHNFVFNPLIKELATRGHNVTVISHFPQKTPHKNLHDISLAGKVEVLEDVLPIERTALTIITISFFLAESATENCRIMVSNKKVQDLWKSRPKFDVILVEQFNSDCGLGLASVFEAPTIGLTSHTLMPWHYSRFGIHFNPSFVSFMMLDGGTHPTLFQRVEATLFYWYFRIMYKYIQWADHRTLSEHFDNMPHLQEIALQMKMILLYQNYALTGSQLLPANVKEVQGYHVAKPNPLPDKLKKFIDDSEHGVIYISFGSMLKSNSLPKKKLDAILGVMGELPQRFVWRWEDEHLPGNPKNVFISKWMPQNDILAHPNVLAFFSHCGMLGTTEAIFHGVPVVGLPIFGDQPSNAAAIEESGLGVKIHVSELTKENLLAAFRKVLDPEFKKNVTELSKVWHDRPQTAMDSAVYWVEHTARHSKFLHRTRAVEVPLYQYYCLDIISIFVGVVLAIASLFKYLCCTKSKSNIQALKKGKGKSKKE